ncbi:hypothetical protein ES288_D04G004500v1 [Gossypium darwinii]|uniref:Uncharacterized protein n=1 Tax=Gossypium darwinii TaxID=34276 RepID=A0A5D2CRQ9_GOSDA|nr:hypothetical protein ES288_D04G004500v1 [Gossypium darwinii]
MSSQRRESTIVLHVHCGPARPSLCIMHATTPHPSAAASVKHAKQLARCSFSLACFCRHVLSTLLLVSYAP